MGLELKDVEVTIFKMDSHYDANFGSWIRNEKNAAVIGHHLNKYIDEYSPCDFIVVLKWIVRSWTLRSIILLSRSMMLQDIQSMSNSRKNDTYTQFRNRISILSGLIYTWNNFFTTEFLITFAKGLEIHQKCSLFVNTLSYFENERSRALIGLLCEKTEKRIKDVLLRAFLSKRAQKRHSKRKAGGDLLKAFLIL